MMRLTLSASILAGVFAVSAPALNGQTTSAITVNRGSFAVVPYGGFMVSEAFVEGPLDTRLGAVSMPMYGIQASLPLAPGASLVGTIGYASGNLEVGVPILGGIDIGDSNALIMDASAELRASLGRVAPLVQFGGGAIRREVSVAGISADGTDFHVSAGIGVDIPIASNVGLRLMAKDHYGKADFGGVGEFRARTRDIHALAITGGLQITF
jgi:hypothetical protein